MSKEQYERLHEILQRYFTSLEYQVPYHTEYSGEEENIQLPEYLFDIFTYELSIILNSKIFHDGQFHPTRNRSYQINNLEEFVWLLCNKINNFRYIYNEVGIAASHFLNLLHAIDLNIDSVRRYFGKKRGQELDTLKEEINNWFATTQVESSVPVSFTTERELSDYATDLFKKHINAPDQAIFVGVSKLLKLFGVKVNQKTVSMRDYRKRKASPLGNGE